ncbi:hypothetical protein [Nocardia cyriacigeorgica]|uniref:hypothetical protein n=1 Tax=Nocardia cyriacigeorgica TaxID=135487 RepID=UPI0024586500|nr:hypothetical protein [Nocardia cyriacigeorgica]
MMQMRSRSAVLDFVDEVTVRYGSLEAFFTQLRADLDDEPTVVLPVLTDIPTEPTGWSAVKPPEPSSDIATPEPQRITDTTEAAADPADKGRKGAATLWGRLLRRK